MKTRAAAYVRVSSDDQTELSPDAQLRILTEYANEKKLIIDPAHIYIDEGYSARTSKRPEFMRMIRDAKTKPRPFDVILCHKFDRFSRSREDSVVFKALLKREQGIDVEFIAEPIVEGNFAVIHKALLESMAEYYSLNLSDEVKKGMTEKALRGGFQSKPPLGYVIPNPGDPLTINEQEANIVRLIYDKFVKEQWSYYAISKYLNQEINVRTRTGSQFNTAKVKYLLSNELYAGLLVWNKRDEKKRYRPRSEWIITEGIHDPIVDKHLFTQAQERMNAIRARYNSKPPHWYKHWLTGLLKCGHCGSTMNYLSRESVGRSASYRCKDYGNGKCTHTNSIILPKIEPAVLDALDRMRSGKMPLRRNKARKAEGNPEVQLVKQKLSQYEQRYDRVKEAYEAGVDTLAEYAENKRRLVEEESQLTKRLTELIDSVETVNTTDTIKQLGTLYDLLSDPDVDLEAKINASHQVIDKIVFTRESRSDATVEVYLNY